MCGSRYTLKNWVGRLDTLFFLKTFFLEYSDLLGNVSNKIKTDIKVSFLKIQPCFNLFTSKTECIEI